MWRLLPTNNVFTLEASFCGPNQGPRTDTHYRIRDYHSIGTKLCQTILVFAKIECPFLQKYLNDREKEEKEEKEQAIQESNTKTEEIKESE